jgi:hypothetical protein
LLEKIKITSEQEKQTLEKELAKINTELESYLREQMDDFDYDDDFIDDSDLGAEVEEDFLTESVDGMIKEISELPLAMIKQLYALRVYPSHVLEVLFEKGKDELAKYAVSKHEYEKRVISEIRAAAGESIYSKIPETLGMDDDDDDDDELEEEIIKLDDVGEQTEEEGEEDQEDYNSDEAETELEQDESKIRVKAPLVSEPLVKTSISKADKIKWALMMIKAATGTPPHNNPYIFSLSDTLSTSDGAKIASCKPLVRYIEENIAGKYIDVKGFENTSTYQLLMDGIRSLMGSYPDVTLFSPEAIKEYNRILGKVALSGIDPKLDFRTHKIKNATVKEQIVEWVNSPRPNLIRLIISYIFHILGQDVYTPIYAKIVGIMIAKFNKLEGREVLSTSMGSAMWGLECLSDDTIRGRLQHIANLDDYTRTETPVVEEESVAPMIAETPLMVEIPVIRETPLMVETPIIIEPTPMVVETPLVFNDFSANLPDITMSAPTIIDTTPTASTISIPDKHTDGRPVTVLKPKRKVTPTLLPKGTIVTKTFGF